MTNRSLDPTRNLIAEFQAGRISRRQFLRLLATVTSSAALASVTTVAAGNSNLSPRSAVSPAKQATPQIMIYGGAQDIATIDPYDRTDYAINAMMRQLYDRLFRFEDGWPQPVEPGLVQNWGASDDAKEWTFELTDQAKFHDGTPVTAESVVFSYQQTLKAKKQRSSLLAGFLKENGVVAKDSKTVVMTLTTPYGSFDRLLAFLQQPIVNMEIAKANDIDGDGGSTYLIDKDAGSGPFQVKSWQIGSAYEIEAIENYWQGWPGESHLSGVVWKKPKMLAHAKQVCFPVILM